MTEQSDLTYDPSDLPIDEPDDEGAQPDLDREADAADVLENRREVGGDDEDYPRA